MKIRLNWDYFKGDFLQGKLMDENLKKAQAESLRLASGSCRGADFTAWYTLPQDLDQNELQRIKEAALEIRQHSQVLVVIGIGGSYLGARAAIELLGGRHFNDFSPLVIYFAGNSICPRELSDIMRLCEDKDVAINVISKSGTTLEPAVAFRFFKEYMEKRYGKDGARNRIFATTDRSRGALRSLAQQEGYRTFTVPDGVGGRYSVLSAVGLLPIAAAGFNVDSLLDGAKSAMRQFDNSRDDNICNRYAALRNTLYQSGKNIEIFSCFDPAFSMFGEWLKQLFGESEGKEGRGIFPASMIFSTDLHSMGQYIQQGERTLFETFISFKEPPADLTVTYQQDDFDGLNYLAGQKMSEINRTAQEATIEAHSDGGVPCIVIESDSCREFELGYLLYFFQRACAISGAALGVNPFDQPGVEAYKTNMFRLLKRPGYEN